MGSSQACLAANEKALYWLDLFPVELQRTAEKLIKKKSIVEAVLKGLKLMSQLRPNKVKD